MNNSQRNILSWMLFIVAIPVGLLVSDEVRHPHHSDADKTLAFVVVFTVFIGLGLVIRAGKTKDGEGD